MGEVVLLMRGFLKSYLELFVQFLEIDFVLLSSNTLKLLHHNVCWTFHLIRWKSVHFEKSGVLELKQVYVIATDVMLSK